MWLSDAQKIGVALTTFGTLFMFLGVMMFFDAALLALGNVCSLTRSGLGHSHFITDAAEGPGCVSFFYYPFHTSTSICESNTVFHTVPTRFYTKLCLVV
ncbi:hypothetical protein DEU56DRAFT_780006 [Suillus clintonianus]|uniref:uncharacterized protein n=1 Tax=Suillus clintonianus TaxID=1904413 RepID=UPI001B8742B4|nr:uncharacterized protein DEU56DRAFT_780006 [Suillus clintonianus]KAG2150441.1 hypothetical protein DEU56DRAFT_780006 [Suillus clintonianus]